MRPSSRTANSARQALPAHGPARAGAGTSHHRHIDLPRHGHDVLAEKAEAEMTQL